MNPTNAVLSCLSNRKSVRAFTKQPVPSSVKEAILAAAMAAPTAGNQQLYTIVDVTDPALKKRLAVTCDHQPFIGEAPIVLLFLADAQKWYDAFSMAGCSPRLPGPGELMLAVDDALIAAQNAVIAGESLGLGSCYIGDIMELCETHRALLHLPNYVFPAAMLVMGYPTPQQAAREKPARCPKECIVYENTYPKMGESELRQLMSTHAAAKDLDEWLRAFCQRKHQSAFAIEMSRSVGLYLQSFSQSAKTRPALRPLFEDYSICQWEPEIHVDLPNGLCFFSKAKDEQSLLCQTALVPLHTRRQEDGWKGFMLEGPLAFSCIGILADISRVLAQAGIGILAQSTFDTDYVFVKADHFSKALAALSMDGYQVLESVEQGE